MKDREFVLAGEGSPQEPVKPKIGERIQRIQYHIGEIFTLTNSIAEQVYVVSGVRIKFESEYRQLGTENIPDDLLSIEHNLRELLDNLRTCAATLENSL